MYFRDMFYRRENRRLRLQLQKKDIIMASLNEKIDALSKAFADFVAHPPVATVAQDPETAAKLDALKATVDTLQTEVGTDDSNAGAASGDAAAGQAAS